jgi:hypothetical protein
MLGVIERGRRTLARPAALGLLATALSVGLVLAQPARAQTVRYAGIIRAFDGASLVLDDVGPGLAERPEAPITHRTIEVTRRTALFVAIRAEDATSGFPGDYRETSAELGDLQVGAYVSVQCHPEGSRCKAVRVTIVRTARS